MAGPYGSGGSRKYLLASLDQSLKRMGLDYVDIFYSHRVDENTPMEETASAPPTPYRAAKRCMSASHPIRQSVRKKWPS